MSHDIAVVNGKSQMAFVGQVPWHGLGQRLPAGATIEEWAQAAGFAHTILGAPVTYNVNGQTHVMDGWRVLYCSDNNQPLSVVSDQFKIVQPAEILEFFRDIVSAGGFHIHTAGMLNERRRYWAMAKNGDGTEAEIVPGDKIRLNLLAATAADGTQKTIIKPTSIRVVCANTLGMALRGQDSREIKVSHKSKFDAEAVKRQLGIVWPAFGAHVAELRALAVKQFNPEQARELLNTLLSKPAKSTSVIEAVRTDGATLPAVQAAQAVADASGTFAALLNGPARLADPNATEYAAPIVTEQEQAERREPRAVAKIIELFNGSGRGAMIEGVHGTAWGLLNAFTEYTDYQASRNQNNRVNSAWFGPAEQAKADFLELLKAA